MRGFKLGFKSEVQLLWPAWVAGGISLKTWARIARAQRAWGFGDCCMLTKGFNFGFGSRTAQPPRSGSFLRRIQNWKIIFTCKNCRFIKVALHGWIHQICQIFKFAFAKNNDVIYFYNQRLFIRNANIKAHFFAHFLLSIKILNSLDVAWFSLRINRRRIDAVFCFARWLTAYLNRL